MAASFGRGKNNDILKEQIIQEKKYVFLQC